MNAARNGTKCLECDGYGGWPRDCVPCEGTGRRGGIRGELQWRTWRQVQQHGLPLEPDVLTEIEP